jgi:hypothetical protein
VNKNLDRYNPVSSARKEAYAVKPETRFSCDHIQLQHIVSGKRPTTMILMAAVLTIAAVLLRPTECSAQERVVCQTSGSTQTCTITEPNVTQHQTTYPTILFHPGSFVTVHAGGCVQSGGSGQTWHRYVDPSGPDADHLYHGLISFPGSGGLIRFSPASQTTAGWTFQLAKNAPDNVSLSLGFEDQDGDYGDNGYWGHDRDNGPNGQCPVPGTQFADLGKPAWVTIVISTTGTPTPNKAMDLISDTVDPNDLPLNPWWAYEKGVDHLPGDPQGPPDPERQCGLTYIDPDNVDLGINLVGGHCTTQSPSVNQGTGLNGELCRYAAENGVLAGHLNWFVSTYAGKIKWDDWSGTFKPLHPTKSGDDDYNFFFLPDSGTGLTASRPQSIGLEFDSDEVVDRIDKGWWNDFHKQVDNDGGPDGAAAQSILNAPAIVIGLMGLDSEHGAYSELHPVYGLAIHINSDAGQAGTDDWVFLARNYGNEGYCSDGNMTVPQLTTLSFFIPRDNAIGDDPANPTGLNELYSTNDNNSVALSFVPGGALISFNVGSPQDQTLYSGHVQFHWQLSGASGRAGIGIKNENIGGLLKPAVPGKPPGPAGRAVHLPPGQIKANPVVINTDVDAEELSGKVLGGFPPSVQPTVNALLVKKPAAAHAIQVRRVTPSLRPLIRRATPTYIRATKVPDPAREAREAQLLKLYCDTYPGGKSQYLTVRSCARLTIKPKEILRKP